MRQGGTQTTYVVEARRVWSSPYGAYSYLNGEEPTLLNYVIKNKRGSDSD